MSIQEAEVAVQIAKSNLQAAEVAAELAVDIADLKLEKALVQEKLARLNGLGIVLIMDIPRKDKYLHQIQRLERNIKNLESLGEASQVTAKQLGERDEKIARLEQENTKLKSEAKSKKQNPGSQSTPRPTTMQQAMRSMLGEKHQSDARKRARPNWWR